MTSFVICTNDTTMIWIEVMMRHHLIVCVPLRIKFQLFRASKKIDSRNNIDDDTHHHDHYHLNMYFVINQFVCDAVWSCWINLQFDRQTIEYCRCSTLFYISNQVRILYAPFSLNWLLMNNLFVQIDVHNIYLYEVYCLY